MNTLKIYFNHRCSKCRTLLARLKDCHVEVEIIEYLNQPLSEDAVRNLTNIIVDPVVDLVRKDSRFEELKLDRETCQAPDSIIELLTNHPELLQRPIVVTDNQAWIVRSPARIEELLRQFA